MLKYTDPTNLRQIILLATLSERAVEITEYHAFESP